MKKITVTITKKGESTITAEGFVGESCRGATEPYRKALGDQTQEMLTPEYYAEQTDTNTQEQTQ